MRHVLLTIAFLLLVSFAVPADEAAAQIVQVTNIEIRMVKTSKEPPLRVTAQTRNPNDFAVRDVEVDCTIKDEAGNEVARYTSIIHEVLEPNRRITTKNLNVGAWPETGYAALCVSRRASRVTPAQTPSPPPAAATQ